MLSNLTIVVWSLWSFSLARFRMYILLSLNANTLLRSSSELTDFFQLSKSSKSCIQSYIHVGLITRLFWEYKSEIFSCIGKPTSAAQFQRHEQILRNHIDNNGKYMMIDKPCKPAANDGPCQKFLSDNAVAFCPFLLWPSRHWGQTGAPPLAATVTIFRFVQQNDLMIFLNSG